LLPLFEDEQPQVRLAAVIAAGELKAAESVIPLQTALADADPQVRAAVEGALQQVLTANAQRAVRVGRMQPASIGQR
jgi:HEAT repeat protein